MTKITIKDLQPENSSDIQELSTEESARVVGGFNISQVQQLLQRQQSSPQVQVLTSLLSNVLDRLSEVASATARNLR
jgi:hypothetical protein